MSDSYSSALTVAVFREFTFPSALRFESYAFFFSRFSDVNAPRGFDVFDEDAHVDASEK